MAARLLHGARSRRPREDQERVGSIPQRASTIPLPSTSARGQPHAPSASKRRGGQEAQSPMPAAPAVTRSTTIASHPREMSRPTYLDRSQPVSRGLEAGMGTHTEITASPRPRNRLQRKASSIDQHSNFTRSAVMSTTLYSTAMPEPIPEAIPHITAKAIPTTTYVDPFVDSVLGIDLPPVSSSQSSFASTPTPFATSSSRMAQYMSRQPLPAIATDDLPAPPTPGFARSSTASTRCSESPGPFSRTSTPTTVSSYSPGLTSTPKLGFRPKPSVSPAMSRPPVTRRKGAGTPDLGLTAVRESLASSTSSAVEPAEVAAEVAAASAGQTRRQSLTEPPTTTSTRLPSKKAAPSRIATRAAPKADSQARAETQDRATSKATPLVEPRPKQASQPRPAAAERSKIPPPRPSRQGTPNIIESMPTMIIASNLPYLATTGRTRQQSKERRSSEDKRNPPSTSTIRSPSASSTISNGTLKRASTGPRSSSPHLYSRESSTSRDATAPSPRKPTSRDPSPTTASLAKPSTSRFGLFSRRRAPGEDHAGRAERAAKKGPAAGTGHEGYGKYARRGRSSTIGSASTRALSTSTERTSTSTRPSSSRKSSFGSDTQPELDDFYKDRLEPVVIGGGGRIKENRNSGLGLSQLTAAPESTRTVRSAVENGLQAVRKQFRPASPARERSVDASGDTRDRLPPPRLGLTTSSSSAAIPTLAHRRSMNRLRNASDSIPIPSPINTTTAAVAPSPAINSYDTVQSSVPMTEDSTLSADDYSEGREGNWLKPAKRVKFPRKWNFFQRSQESPKIPAGAGSVALDSAPPLPATIAKVSDAKPVAHYALLDGSEADEPTTLEDILRDIEREMEFRKEADATTHGQLAPGAAVRERQPSLLLPSPPKFPMRFEDLPRPSSPKVLLNRPLVQSPQAMPNPRSRLQQVGRIPRVVSKRDRLHKASPQSFSRPFARSHHQQTSSEPAPSLTQTSLPIASPTSYFALPVASPSVDVTSSLRFPLYGPLDNVEGDGEFIAFSPRKNSETSGDSSSGAMSFAITALLSKAGSVVEDEVWNEYDELLDHVASPIGTLLETPEMPNRFSSVSQLLGSSKVQENGVRIVDNDNNYDHFSPRYAPPQHSLPEIPQSMDYPSLRGGELLTPPALSDAHSGLVDRSSNGLSASRQSTGSESRYSSQTLMTDIRSSTASDQTHASMKLLGYGNVHDPRDSLRFSALMTSRWLTFDRVLFSPAAEDLVGGRASSILVLDGLANDDWSSYCALSYPSATVYSLSPSPSPKPDADYAPPPNHHHIHHPSPQHPFPFPKALFAAVVLRFPPAATPATLHHTVSECKRVLRPGGTLELSVLDMDLVNVGPRVRHALHDLKLRIHTARPDVSLSPTGDAIERLLGRRGFEGLRSCVLSVPVAGRVADSRAGSLDEATAAVMGDPDSQPSGRAFGELLRASAAAAGEVMPMAGVVAGVGRWWWSRCYEAAVTAPGRAPGPSIWADRSLLRECEAAGTGFRLTVAYAVKPESLRRRTVSV